MKKISLAVMVILGSMIISNVALAKDFWLTDQNGNEKYTFHNNEIPWFNVVLKNNANSLDGWWGEPGNQHNVDVTGLTGGSKVSFSLFNWGWPTPQSDGSYNVHFNGYGTLKAAVAPEPISAMLFLLGGGALAVKKLRRKRL